MRVLRPHRRGATLIELLLFLAILSLVIGMILPILFASTENRLLQQTISTVEQNGTQGMQSIGLRVRQAERIIDPPMGQTGAVLALQTGSGATDPTIIGLSSGSLVIIRRATREVITSPQVAVEDFTVINTSTSATRQSVRIVFRLSRTLRLQQPHSYARTFEGGFNLLPDDVTVGNYCGCSAPTCVGGTTYQWEVCEQIYCYSASTSLQCQ